MLCDKCNSNTYLESDYCIICKECGVATITNNSFDSLCKTCSNELNKCKRCGCNMESKIQLKNVSVLNLFIIHEKQLQLIDRLSSDLKLTVDENKKVILELKLAKLKDELKVFENTIMSANQKIW